MTILDFPNHMAASHLKNGLDYFHKKRVSEVVDLNGEWSADVEGREFYSVTVSLQGKYITDASCECRAFNHEDYCKHVVALLYTIKDRLFNPPKKKTLVTPYLGSLLNGLSAEDLRLFLLSQLHDDKYLVDDLTEFAEGTLDNEAVAGYMDTINKTFRHVANIEDYPSPENGILAAKAAGKLLGNAKKLLAEGDISAAMNIAFAIIAKKASFDKYGVDKEGYYESIVADTFRFLDELCNTNELNEYDSKRLTHRAWEGVFWEEYEMPLYPVHWLDLLVQHGDIAEKKTELLEMLEELKENETAGSITYKRLNKAIEVIAGDEPRKAKVIHKPADVPASAEQPLRPMPVPPVKKQPAATGKKTAPALSEKKIAFLKNKELLLTAIDAEKATEKKEKYPALQKELIELMQQNSDIFGVREMAVKFYEETNDAFFYEALKGTYMLSEWEKLVASKPGIVRKMN